MSIEPLTPDELAVVNHVRRDGPCRLTELAVWSGLGREEAERHLLSLEQRGLVCNDSGTWSFVAGAERSKAAQAAIL